MSSKRVRDGSRARERWPRSEPRARPGRAGDSASSTRSGRTSRNRECCDGPEAHDDGEVALSSDALQIEIVSTGQDSSSASVRITAAEATPLLVLATAWEVVDSDFLQPMPQDASYELGVVGDCEPA